SRRPTPGRRGPAGRAGTGGRTWAASSGWWPCGAWPARGGAGGRRRRWRSSVTSPDPVTEALRLVSAHLPAEAPDPPVLTGLADGAGQRAGGGDLQQADRARQEQARDHASDLAAHDAHSQA